MLLLVAVSQDSTTQTTTSSLSSIQSRTMLGVVSKWKVLLISLQLLEANRSSSEKEDVPRALSQFTAHCTSFCQPLLLVQR